MIQNFKTLNEKKAISEISKVDKIMFIQIRKQKFFAKVLLKKYPQFEFRAVF